MEDKSINPKLVELLEKMSYSEVENLKSQTKDENLLKEILYTLKMVPKLRPKREDNASLPELFEIAELNIGEQDDEKEKQSYKSKSTTLIPEFNNFEEDEHDHGEKAEKDNQKKEEESEEKNKNVIKKPFGNNKFKKSNSVSELSKPFFSLKLTEEQIDWNDNNNKKKISKPFSFNIKKRISILEILEKKNRRLLNITFDVDFCENKKEEKM